MTPRPGAAEGRQQPIVAVWAIVVLTSLVFDYPQTAEDAWVRIIAAPTALAFLLIVIPLGYRIGDSLRNILRRRRSGARKEKA